MSDIFREVDRSMFQTQDREYKMIAGAGCLAMLLIFLVCAGGWITHIVVCLQNELWGFLIAGAIFAPIGIIHGWLIWFGVV